MTNVKDRVNVNNNVENVVKVNTYNVAENFVNGDHNFYV